MRARLLGMLAVVTAAAVLAGLPSTPAQAGPRAICGTLVGSDGRYVRANVGVLLYRGTTLVDLDGGGAPSLTVELNPGLTDDGVEAGTSGDDGSLEDTFCFDAIPGDITAFTLEALPVGADATATYVRYGGASTARASLPGAGRSGLALELPLQCSEGGDTGSIVVQAYSNGQPTNIAAVTAVGEGPSHTTGRQGLVVVDDGGNGTRSPLVITGLEPGTRYGVQVVFANRARRSTFADVAVRSCQTTTIRAWTGAKPFGTPDRWTSRPQTVNGFYEPVAGDFDGDGRSDLWWHAPSAPLDHLWLARPGGATFDVRSYAVPGAHRPAAGDFDGNGVDDLFLFGPGSAPDHLWYFEPGGASHTRVAVTADAPSTTRPLAGDFDGNGVDDILFYDPVGPDSIWYHEPGGGRTVRPVQLGGNSNVVVGDVDGDGRDDVFQHDTLTGAVRIHRGTPTGDLVPTTDSTARTYRPVLGDFSCDLRADVIMYQPGPAIDVLWRVRSSTAPFFAKGGTGLGIGGSYLYPIVGDFDGNGCDDVFWYQPGPTREAIWLNSQVGWTLPRSTVSGAF